MTQLEMITSTEASGSGICSISPLQELDVRDAGLPLVLPRQRQHLVGHVEAVGLAGRPDAARREQDVDAAARSEVEHHLSLMQLGERGGIAAPERGEDRLGGKGGRLGLGVEVGGDGVVLGAAAARGAAAGGLGAAGHRSAASP